MGRVGTALAAASLLVAGTVIGAVTQHLASADIGSGERLVFVPLPEPCRLVDTRPAFAVGPKTSPLGPGEVYEIKGRPPGPTGECTTISTSARALSLNVTAVGATAPTFLTIWPEGPLPGASSLNPSPGEPPTPNAVTTNLSGHGAFSIYNLAGEVHVIVDVVGYYDDHHHDDRSAVEFVSGDQSVPLTTTDAVIRTIDLDTDVAGSAIVTASGYFDFDGVGEDVARCSITNGALTIDPSQLIIATSPSDPPPSQFFLNVFESFSSTVVYPVQAGTSTFNLICSKGIGSVWVGDTSLVAQFVPNRS